MPTEIKQRREPNYVGRGLLFVTAMLGLAFLFWWPLFKYSVHYWLG